MRRLSGCILDHENKLILKPVAVRQVREYIQYNGQVTGVQYSTVHNTVQYSTVQYSVQYSAVQVSEYRGQ